MLPLGGGPAAGPASVVQGWPSGCTCRRRWRPSWCSAARPTPRARAAISVPRSSDLSDPYALAGMAEAVDADRRHRARRRHHPGARRLRRGRPVRHRAPHPRAPRRRGRRRAVRAPPSARRLRLRPRRPRRGPRRRRLAGHHLRLRHHGGGHGARRARAAGIGVVVTDHHLPGRRSCRPPSPSSIRSGRTTPPGSRRSAAPASPSSWCRRWCRRSASRPTCPTTCSTWWRSPPWPTWCRSRARTGSW